MCIGMYFHINLLVEPFSTVCADEWFVVSVSAHVRMQIGCAVEGFSAPGADVGFDGGVRQTMSC